MASKRRLGLLLIAVVLGIMLLAVCAQSIADRPISRAAPRDVSPALPMEPDVLRALSQAEADDTVRVIVDVRGRANLDAAIEAASGATDAQARLVSALQEAALRAQAPLVAYLEDARAESQVERYTQLWIVNSIAVQARPSVIRALAARPDVARLRLDHYRQWITGADSQSPIPRSTAHSPQSIEWNVSKIRADEVWAALHISGTGVVVAGMDTGVDWLHPALQANYRGYNPHGPSNHAFSWHDATSLGALYPVDDNGHGSHTMGTIAGQGGIGVAPGARWIAVKAFSSGGFAYDSWVHAGFQWLLAPGGSAALAPDVVNCSWGSDNGYLTTFQPDLQALRAAGIFVVFSNGNNGSGDGTVGSPASLPEAFAVGAIDEYDQVANFSSRGPSPWGQIRPHVAAPGVRVRSSLPGGTYGRKNGTSMAAPHAAGVAVLLRSISPTLSITRAAYIITRTAVPLGSPIPNNDAGWGRVDAFAAAATLAHHGAISGTVIRAGNGAPIIGGRVSAVSALNGGGGIAATGADGAYRLTLAPDTYDVTISAFGYYSVTVSGVAVSTDTTTAVDAALTAMPTGTLQTRVTDAATGQPITAALTLLRTPLEATASAYTFILPAGSYTLHARRLGYRILTATAHITAGQVTTLSLALPPAPTILLVDSGRWYNGSQASYFRQSLDELAYAYDQWPVRRLPDEAPTASDLAPYDVTIWSAPRDGPGYIGAQDAITGYLSAGGNLFISGQDIGYLDDAWFGYPYYRHYLKSRLVLDNANQWTLEGSPDGLFAGLTITITGAGGADNQQYPDQIAVLDPDAAAPVFAYQDGGCGGVGTGTCLDYRALYLSFGFEAINDAASRRAVMSRTLAWMTAPAPAFGLELTPAEQSRIGLPGATVTHTLRVRHLGQGGGSDSVALSIDGADWASTLSTSAIALSPCASQTVVISVTLPPTAGWDARDVVTVTARSTLSPTLFQTATVATKTPAPVLLVDDDRWYEQRQKYEAAMDGADLPYDFWQTCPATGGCTEQSPPAEILRRYPIVVWWTGYDWYQPLTGEQIATLAGYLNGGGRLLLSSQDYVYYHHARPFTRHHLGVLTYTEDVTPTQAVGTPHDPIGQGLGPWALSYPFDNQADSVAPMPETAVPFRDEARGGIALARREGDYATAFFAFPFEALPEAARPEAMAQTVGWLSWLGRSTFAVQRDAASGGDPLTYTAVLRNDGPAALSASFSNTLPLSLTLAPGSLTGPALYDAPTRRVSWQGPLAAGEQLTITYRATLTTGLPAYAPIVNAAHLGIEDQSIRFRRAAVVRAGAPDLSSSLLRCAPGAAQPGAVVTCTLALVNAGPADAPAAAVTTTLPAGGRIMTDSLSLVGGGAAQVTRSTLHWAGPLTAGGRVTVTYRVALPGDLTFESIYAVAFVEDGAGGAWERGAWVVADIRRYYLPLVLAEE